MAGENRKSKANASRNANGSSNSANNAVAPCDDSFNQPDALANLTKIIQAQHTALAASNQSLYQALKESFVTSEAVTQGEIYKFQQRLDKLENDNSNLRASLEAAETKNQELTDQLEKANANIDEIEQSSRRPCIIVNNLPKENGRSEYDSFINMCEGKVKLGTDEMSVIRNKITKIYRLGKLQNENDNDASNRKPRPLLVRSVDDNIRNLVFKQKKQLKGTGIVISEYLTPTRSALLKKCYEKIPGSVTQRSIWTDNGRILVKKTGGNIVNITKELDITTFLSNNSDISQSTT